MGSQGILQPESRVAALAQSRSDFDPARRVPMLSGRDKHLHSDVSKSFGLFLWGIAFNNDCRDGIHGRDVVCGDAEQFLVEYRDRGCAASCKHRTFE